VLLAHGDVEQLNLGEEHFGHCLCFDGLLDLKSGLIHSSSML
jgi:hypothetical protein